MAKESFLLWFGQLWSTSIMIIVHLGISIKAVFGVCWKWLQDKKRVTVGILFYFSLKSNLTTGRSKFIWRTSKIKKTTWLDRWMWKQCFSLRHQFFEANGIDMQYGLLLLWNLQSKHDMNELIWLRGIENQRLSVRFNWKNISNYKWNLELCKCNLCLKCICIEIFDNFFYCLTWKTVKNRIYHLFLSVSIPEIWAFKLLEILRKNVKRKLSILCPFNKNCDVTSRTSTYSIFKSNVV